VAGRIDLITEEAWQKVTDKNQLLFIAKIMARQGQYSIGKSGLLKQSVFRKLQILIPDKFDPNYFNGLHK
jgi:hypothetical protein